MGMKTLQSYVPALSYGKGTASSITMNIAGVLATGNDQDRWYVPPALSIPYNGNQAKNAIRIAGLQGLYQVAPVGAATGADTFLLNRVTVGGSVILLATITMTSLKAAAAINLAPSGRGVALYAGEYLRLDCSALATYATSVPEWFRLQVSYVSFGIKA